ncbi:ribbon-helix-helix protein, CopG family [Streptomyces sp. A7024]|uniref:Ribbon-helix-helix protein, CopG family n=1 Tax=Streptomyces coryli TaxID=1128680 RepID=A0A6G4TUN1_9ACTN|nr:ribbon-helix-helix protein, CopG family [Streptomyces coryli]NGN63166.1 ribbon-helix-helix protein, CopG family [Streptomyces coryli]
MPKISVELTEEELARVNEHAERLGMSTRSWAKQLLVSDADKARFLTAARSALPTALEAVKDAPAGLR